VCIVFIENIFLLICFFFLIITLSTVYCIRFLNLKIQIKQLLDKKQIMYFIQKIEITPKQLGMGIHNVYKSSLKIKFSFKINEVFGNF
jgi:hypothetical protein